ncbi:MAG: recombinase family protein [Patescibacteria group bacterium]|nr:recombinase family protein [Patescibacteria group bacterium]
MTERRAIGYVRVSSVGGRSGPGYHTLEIQRASIERTATFHRYELVDVLTDEDQSGKTRQRPMFTAAMRRVLAGEADALIVWKVSRFSRNWREAAEDVETLLEADKDLLSEEGFDTATAGGRLLLRILFSMANWEHDVLGEHWELIKGKAVRDRGSWLGNAPFGYRTLRGGVLEPTADAEHVVRLFQARASGMLWGDLAVMLNEIRPRAGGTRQEIKDVRRIIQNRVYLGEVRWRDEINPRAHDAIVSPELWDAASRVQDNAPRRQHRPRLREFPLTGWLRCSGCGGPMSGSTIADPKGVKRGNYICSRRHGGCPRPQSISAEAAERWALKEAATVHTDLRARQVADDGTYARALERRGEIEAALHELASIEIRRELGEDWLPMMRRLRAEKAAIDKQDAPAITIGVEPWEDLPLERKWAELRRIAPLGALVSPVVQRMRPDLRLAFIVDDLDADTVQG